MAYETTITRENIPDDDSGSTPAIDPNLSLVFDEELTGTVNGTNTVFTTAQAFSGITVSKSGVTQHVSDDFTITGANQITFVTAPISGTNITATYSVSHSGSIPTELSIMMTLYPVGSVYTNTTNADSPATLFGFGTWVALTGRVLVGKATSGTFGTIGATGGAETHTLTIAEMPTHDHNGKIWGTSNGDYIGLSGGGQGGWGLANDGTNNNIYRAVIQSQGGGGSHNNLQPYRVVYMWERTA